MNFKNWLLNEAFDTVTDFLLNPEHRNKTWPELENEFKASGGEIIGIGKFGMVFMHPSWPYVLKMYSDQYYTAFVRFAYKNPMSAFPKFFGPPQKVLPFYKRYPIQTTQYLVRMEKLVPISAQLFELIDVNYNQGIQYLTALEKGYADSEYEKVIYPKTNERKAGQQPTTIKVKHFQAIIDLLKQYPKMLALFKGMELVQQNVAGSFDLHQGNLMQRANGDIVLIDPVWAGSNPYIDAARLRDMEAGGYGDDAYDDWEPSVIGGKYPKKKRIKKPKIQPISSDNLPF